MKKTIITFAALGAAAAVPSVAHAQSALPGEGFVGVQAGIHDLGLNDIEDDFDIDLDSSSTFVGAFAGYDLPLGPGAFVGAEVNYNVGFGSIDNEFGLAGRLGTSLPGGAKVYARGGYQVIDFDFEEIFDVEDDAVFDNLEDSEGDYIVGLGVDFPLGGSLVRVNLDSVSFDTIRASAGVGLRF